MPQPGASLLSYPAAIPLSTQTLNHLSELIRAHRVQRRCRWRRLEPGRQALLVLAHLHNGDTYTRLVSGVGVATTTAWRSVREAVDLLAGLADDLRAAMVRAARLAYAILDGTLLPIDRPRPEALLLRQTQATRRQRPRLGRCGRPAGVGLARATRRRARPDRWPHRRPHRRHHRGERGNPGGQGIPGRRRQHPHPVQTPPSAPAAVAPTESRQPPMPNSARSANEPSPPSRPGKCWSSCAAAHTEPPRSCRPSLCSTTPNTRLATMKRAQGVR